MSFYRKTLNFFTNPAPNLKGHSLLPILIGAMVIVSFSNINAETISGDGSSQFLAAHGVSRVGTTYESDSGNGIKLIQYDPVDNGTSILLTFQISNNSASTIIDYTTISQNLKKTIDDFSRMIGISKYALGGRLDFSVAVEGVNTGNYKYRYDAGDWSSLDLDTGFILLDGPQGVSPLLCDGTIDPGEFLKFTLSFRKNSVLGYNFSSISFDTTAVFIESVKGYVDQSTFISTSALGYEVYGEPDTNELTQLTLSIPQGFNHAPVRLPITHGTPENVVVISSAPSWVTPVVDVESEDIVLSFATSNMVASSYSATITSISGSEANSLDITANISSLNIVKLISDATRSRIYGLHKDAINEGSVIAMDKDSKANITCVTTGKNPKGFALAADDSELVVLNAEDKTITAINAADFSTSETIKLPLFSLSNGNSYGGHICYGKNGVLYYTDTAWGPVLRVFDRTNKLILQSVTSYRSGSNHGYGDFAVTDDYSAMFAWTLFGGYAGSWIEKFEIYTDGTLNLVDATSQSYPSVLRKDPTGAPVLIDSQNASVFIKQFQVQALSVTNTVRSFSSAIFSKSDDDRFAATSSALYDTNGGSKVLNLPESSSVQVFTHDSQNFFYFNSDAKTIDYIDLTTPLEWPIGYYSVTTDLDGDGVSLLEEHAFGLNPYVKDHPSYTFGTINTNGAIHPSLTYNRHLGRTGFRISIENTSSLTMPDWQPVDGSYVNSTKDLIASITTWSSNIFITGKSYYRINIEYTDE